MNVGGGKGAASLRSAYSDAEGRDSRSGINLIIPYRLVVLRPPMRRVSAMGFGPRCDKGHSLLVGGCTRYDERLQQVS